MSGDSLRVMILRVESMVTVVLNGGNSSKLCQPSSKAIRASHGVILLPGIEQNKNIIANRHRARGREGRGRRVGGPARSIRIGIGDATAPFSVGAARRYIKRSCWARFRDVGSC